MRLETLTRYADGVLLQGDPACEVVEICTDSRSLRRGDLFLALKGDRFDGHEFLGAAGRLGAAGAVVENLPGEKMGSEFALIQVRNTLNALQQIAARYRSALPLKVLAITGSNGKTSTKDFAAAVLAERFRVVKTQGNFNNHIGVPKTLLRAGAADEIGVCEIGTNHPGEIAPLAKIAAPAVAIITNIGVAHIEFLGSREAIAREKGALAEALPRTGHLILNAEDDFSESIARRTAATVITAGIKRGDIRAEDIGQRLEGSRFSIVADGGKVHATLPVPGLHMVRNALLAVAAGKVLGVPIEEAASGLAKVEIASGRLQRKTLRGIEVLDDTYNANPDSVVAALEALAAVPARGRLIAVLGRMGEQGGEAAAGYRRVGEAAARCAVDCLVSVGDEADSITSAARAAGLAKTFHCPSTVEAASLLRDLAAAGDLVLVKGSRAERMETIIERLASP